MLKRLSNLKKLLFVIEHNFRHIKFLADHTHSKNCSQLKTFLQNEPLDLLKKVILKSVSARAGKVVGMRRIFARISLKLREKILGHFLCEYFLMETVFVIRSLRWPLKRYSCDSEHFGGHFLKSKHVGRHFCPYFQGVYPDFQGFAKVSKIFTDFAQVFADFAWIFT